jgi:hypothetical protein
MEKILEKILKELQEINQKLTKKKRNPVVRFVPPTIEDLKNYMKSKNYIDFSKTFFNFYETKNWKVGQNKMQKWKTAVETWVLKEPKLKQQIYKKDMSKYEIQKPKRTRTDFDIISEIRRKHFSKNQ